MSEQSPNTFVNTKVRVYKDTQGNPTIFIVLRGYDYEGEDIMGVHATQEAAEAQKSDLQAKRCGDYVDIEEWQIGQTKN